MKQPMFKIAIGFSVLYLHFYYILLKHNDFRHAGDRSTT